MLTGQKVGRPGRGGKALSQGSLERAAHVFRVGVHWSLP